MKEQPELKVVEVETDSLVPYANNAKLHSELQVDQIANSIKEFGFNDPIAVWENGDGELEIVEGHGRVLAAKKLKIDILPVVYLNHLSDEQRRAYTHVHNQTTLNSGFDFEVLDVEIEDLDFNWEDFGFLEGFNSIQDLMEEDYVGNSIESAGSGDISVTFVFDAKHAESVTKYVKAVGKGQIVQEITEKALSWE